MPHFRSIGLLAALLIAGSVTLVPAAAAGAPPLVVGGKPAEGGSFPWLAFVADFREGGKVVSICSGAVVAPRLILTAAHCAEDVRTGRHNEPAGYRVVTGNVDWTSTEREVLGVSRVVVYGKFSRRFAKDDAALLVLSAPTSSPAIALARRAGDSAWLEQGTGAWLVGWGKTEFAQEEPTRTLEYAETVLQAPRWCKRNAPPFYPHEELCVIDPPGDATGLCDGDSGSPLVLHEEGQEAVDLGIASHVYGPCATSRPTVYTRVDAVYPWVQRWIGSLG